MKCDHADSKVINSRTFAGRRYRRRKCRLCLHRWTTIEYEEDWQELAVLLVEDQMEAARRLALRLGHEDLDVQAP